MRQAVWLLLPLLMAHCSCQRQAEDTPAAPSADGVVADTPAADPAAGDALADAAALDVLGAVRPDALPPGQLLQRYVSTLLNDRAASDAYWRLAPADDRRAGDAVLRHLSQLRSLRVDSDPPLPRDDGTPPQLIEIPVRIRIGTAEGSFVYSGWYRLVPDPQASGWLIQGAQLQPMLD